MSSSVPPLSLGTSIDLGSKLPSRETLFFSSAGSPVISEGKTPGAMVLKRTLEGEREVSYRKGGWSEGEERRRKEKDKPGLQCEFGLEHPGEVDRSGLRGVV
jgi:hypothetical protein